MTIGGTLTVHGAFANTHAVSHAAGTTWIQVPKHPCQAVSKRLLRHEDDLFQFLLVDGLRAHNNLAERSIRPVVKIGGGSRSREGTTTQMARASLFETWQARGQNVCEQCL